MHDPEIVTRGVGKLRTAGAIAHRPHVGSGRLQPLVDLDIAALVEFHAGLLQSDAVGVRYPARSDKKIGAFDSAFAIFAPGMDPKFIAGTPFDPRDRGCEQHVDSFVVK
jgi:hypothetical protein